MREQWTTKMSMCLFERRWCREYKDWWYQYQ